MITRTQICAEARSWAGTRWQHQASLKGVACDCAGFVRGVNRELTGQDVSFPVDYPATWHFFKTDPRMLETCQQYMDPVPLEAIQPGDVLLFKFPLAKVDHHMGIYLGQGRFIHAEMEARMVHESPLDTTWKSRLSHAFRFRDLEE